MLTLLLVVVAAAPVDVIALHTNASAEAQRALAKGLSSRTLIDASGVHGYLHGQEGLFGFQDFNAFSARPVTGWPSPLGDAWRGGVAYCQQVSGPVPWKTTLSGARCCGRRLGRHLWERYLAEKKADQVYVVQSSGARERVVTGVRHGRDDDEELVVTRKGAPADDARLVLEVVEKLLAGEGVRTPRERVPVLFTPVETDPWAPAATGPVAGLTACEKLPASLVVTSPGLTAKSLQDRWLQSAPGKSPPLACTLAFTQHLELKEDLVLSVDDPVVTSVLTCGDITVSTELMSGPLARKPLEVVTSRLLSGLAARLCR